MKLLKKTFMFVLIAALLLSAQHLAPVSASIEPGTVIPDGEYSLSYQYVKDGTTQVSAANDFMVPDTGKLIISEGKAYFEHEVSKADYATFAYLGSRKAGAAKAVITTVGDAETANGQDGYEPVVVRDAANSSNVVVRLTIVDVWKKQDVLMHIDDKENIYNLPVRYNHWYNAQLEIYTTNITLPPLRAAAMEAPEA
ncbi:NEAT domain-containing protein [Cohnella faecalis]|uniref:NEAT domain-containing protein n=1 Tax=Cohnella faecalis TaxID=2315694 RepID=A0A398CKV2_9BACL|nr:NEAT domain-containing protein [Cohnella faecalis]RIE02930.1 hypothetical protein D3H35_20185 [Cohnella faecalis]